MSDALLANRLSPRETVWPRCPMCAASLEVLRIVPGRPGFEHRTLRCPTCGTIYEAQAPSDPTDSNALSSASRRIESAHMNALAGTGPLDTSACLHEEVREIES